jgi:hypothetical protein
MEATNGWQHEIAALLSVARNDDFVERKVYVKKAKKAKKLTALTRKRLNIRVLAIRF